MINAGRVLIIPKGEWTNLESYEMLDLVTRGDIAYIARQASVGVDPATDTQLTYWQPFGTAAKIATTTTPGLVMPDGTTVTIDATGLISANIGISDINNVTITSISNGQILQYNSSTQKWENKSLGSAASRNATSSITSGSIDLIESGAVNSLKQTLETTISNADALKADKDDLASISITGSTNNTGSTITSGTYFYNNGALSKAKADIASGASITSSNTEPITYGLANVFIIKQYTTTINENGFAADGIPLVSGYKAIQAVSLTNAVIAEMAYETNVTNIQFRNWDHSNPDRTLNGTSVTLLVMYLKS
jgi:hypothetical protein